MKKLCTTLAALVALAGASAQDLITLDLTHSTTPLAFNADNGAWVDTYNDDVTSIDSQCFSFVHNSMGDFNTWWGFTASNSADNARQTNTLTYQFSNMAKGGIELNADGTIKTDSYGAPVTSAAVPYLVAYYGSYYGVRPVDMIFAEGKSYDAVGVYVNLNSYPYYCIEYGDAYARAFTNGDAFTLTIHGVSPDNQDKTIDVKLAQYANGNLTINRGWSYVDLTPLGTVNELYFVVNSTDVGEWGMNTPGYFCLDKLMVKPAGAGAPQIAADRAKLAYNRATATVNVDGASFACVYDVLGNQLMSSEQPSFSIAHLPAGVYVVRALNTSLKIVR